MRFTKYITAFLIATQIFPLNVHAGKKTKTTMVIVPVHDGRSDMETENVTVDLRKSLGANSNLHIVDKEKADSVLQYYDRSENPEMTKIEGLLSKSKESYYRFNYIEAKSLANKAISSLKEIPNAVFDHGRNLLDAHLTLGIVAKSMGNVGEARQAFREALRLDPFYKLDSRAFSPSVVNLFENVRSSLDLQPRGSVRVESNPKVAEVYLNGILKGVTPLTLEDMPDGEHYLMISANKYKTVRKKINVVAGEKMKIKEKLTWTAGKKGKLDGKGFVASTGELAQIDEGLRIADLLRVDKAVLVNVDGESGTSGAVSARMVDAKYRTGHKPIVIPYKDGGDYLTRLSEELGSQTHINIASNPEKYSEPLGKGETSLLAKQNHRKISKPVLFGILGGVLAAGLGGGLAAAFAGGGGGGGGGTGSINVTFSK